MRELPAAMLHAEIEASTAVLADLVRSADPALPIPACPQWTLRQLATHVGRAHRWAAEIVSTMSAQFIEFGAVPDGKFPADPAERARWLTAGSATLVGSLREAADDPVWAFGQMSPAGFWARRMAHETLVHRADAEAAADRHTSIDPALAADAIDEWLTVMSGPLPGAQPDLRAGALPAGRSMHVRATDPVLGGPPQWLIRHDADGVGVLAKHAAADVALSGPAAEVLLVLMRRVAPGDAAIQVLGDRALLDSWLEGTAF